MIKDILPAEAASAEAFKDLLNVSLFPEEEVALGRAVDKRRREFSTARACARAALAELGLPPSPIVPGLRGSPSWPSGVVGSMTHCDGYRAAAVAWENDLATIGLDAEPHDVLPEGVLGAISLPRERDLLAELAELAPGVCWDRLLFSAKESVYKAWFPLTEQWLDFEEASIAFDPHGGAFTATLLVPGPVVGGRRLPGFTGRWLVRDGLILTAIAVPAPGRDPRRTTDPTDPAEAGSAVDATGGSGSTGSTESGSRH